MPELNDLAGIFIAPDEAQIKRIWEACAREGFPVDSKGVLQLLMFAVEDSEDGVLGEEPEEEEAPDPLIRAAAYLQENPEKVAAAARAAALTLKNVFQGFRKPK